MTDREIVDLMKSCELINQVRQLVSFGMAEMEQAYLQRNRPSPVEGRRMEFEIAGKICRLFEPKDI
jgi:hypothetical protein